MSTKNKIIYEELSYKLNGIFFDVHNTLGSYANEKQVCDLIEKKCVEHNLYYEREKVLNTSFEGELKGRNRIDFIFENKIIFEAKTKPRLERQDYAQIKRYLIATNVKLGLIANFRDKHLHIRRVVNSQSNAHEINPKKHPHSHIRKSALSADSLGQSADSSVVKFKRIDNSLPLPEYKTHGSVAFDLYTREDATIPPHGFEMLPTNFVIETPEDYALVIAARSSSAKKKGLNMRNGIGIIDQDYSGEEDEIHILIQNLTDQPVTVERGERLAQGMFVKIEKPTFTEVTSMNETSRGGFGSTGDF